MRYGPGLLDNRLLRDKWHQSSLIVRFHLRPSSRHVSHNIRSPMESKYIRIGGNGPIRPFYLTPLFPLEALRVRCHFLYGIFDSLTAGPAFFYSAVRHMIDPEGWDIINHNRPYFKRLAC